MNEEKEDSREDLAVETSRPKLKPPPQFKVVILNDDYTPMEFVVEVLERFFAMDRERATRVMLHVHTRGKGVFRSWSVVLRYLRRGVFQK